jgi:tRNA-dihydrouridine synthase B
MTGSFGRERRGVPLGSTTKDDKKGTGPLRIGSVQLGNNLVVAPMAGVTDRPFRNLCRRLGAGLAVSEMVTADATLYGTRKTVLRLDHSGEPGPVAVQIVGTDPERMAEAARVNVGHGAQIIDINLGCPAKKVCKVAAGSALMRDEPLVARILERVVGAVEVPVTLKMRTGWDLASRNAPRIAELAEQSGVAALAVHGRTRACGYRGSAEYETIRRVKQQVSIPVIANGDIDSPQKAREVLEITGADGVMIGRAAQGRPWLFREMDRFLAGGETLQPPTSAWIRDLLLEHLESLYGLYGQEHGVRVARKHIAWYSASLPGSATFRQRVNQADTPDRQRGLVREYFEAIDNKQAHGQAPAPQ